MRFCVQIQGCLNAQAYPGCNPGASAPTTPPTPAAVVRGFMVHVPLPQSQSSAVPSLCEMLHSVPFFSQSPKTVLIACPCCANVSPAKYQHPAWSVQAQWPPLPLQGSRLTSTPHERFGKWRDVPLSSLKRQGPLNLGTSAPIHLQKHFSGSPVTVTCCSPQHARGISSAQLNFPFLIKQQ